MDRFDKFVVGEYVKFIQKLNTMEELEQERIRIEWAIASRKEIRRKEILEYCPEYDG